MKPCELENILAKAILDLGRDRPWIPPPEAPFVTGNPNYDAQLHYVLVEFGVEVELDRHHDMEDYRVVDEKKFTMFLLRWA